MASFGMAYLLSYSAPVLHAPIQTHILSGATSADSRTQILSGAIDADSRTQILSGAIDADSRTQILTGAISVEKKQRPMSRDARSFGWPNPRETILSGGSMSRRRATVISFEFRSLFVDAFYVPVRRASNSDAVVGGCKWGPIPGVRYRNNHRSFKLSVDICMHAYSCRTCMHRLIHCLYPFGLKYLLLHGPRRVRRKLFQLAVNLGGVKGNHKKSSRDTLHKLY